MKPLSGSRMPHKIPRAGGGMHPAVEALARQHRQVAAVVQVGVGQDDGVDLAGHHRQRSPVAQAQLLVALNSPQSTSSAVPVVPDQELASR
jgi:hypothetical protein